MRTEFVNITQASGFIYHNLQTRTLAGTGLLVTEEEVGAFLLRGSHTARLKPGSTVGRPGKVLWLTPLNQIESDLARETNVVRDRLGLLHCKNKDKLVALHLPGNVIEQMRNARPTAADASRHERFKARADTAAMRRRRAWGYTVDLERFAAGKRDIDGLPERVCQPIPSGHLGTIRVTPLSAVAEVLSDTPERGETPEDNHEAFANRLTLRHGGVDNIRTRLLHLL